MTGQDWSARCDRAVDTPADQFDTPGKEITRDVPPLRPNPEAIVKEQREELAE